MNANNSFPHGVPKVRISDAERNAAMASLGRAFAEGRLSVDEYDSRCQSVTATDYREDLAPLFVDLPRSFHALSQSQPTAGQVARFGGADVERLYSAQEIDAAYRNGRRTRAGILGLTSVGSLVLTSALVSVTSLNWIFLFLIPTVWLMLYVMKLGPDSWYVPSPRAVDKQRLRELHTAEQMRAAELRIQEQEQLAQLKAERKAHATELQNRAIGFVNRALEKRNK